MEIALVSGVLREDKTSNYNRVDFGFVWSNGKDNFDGSIYLYPPFTTCLEPESYGFYETIRLKFPYEYYESWRVVLWFRKQLRSGKIKSFVIQKDGTLTAAPLNFWLSDQCEDVLKYDVSTLVPTDTGPIFGRVSIPIEEIDRFFDGLNKQGEEPSETDNTYRNDETSMTTNHASGRPPKFDSEAFLTEAMKIILDGAPATQAELAKRTLAAYAAAGHRGGKPSQEWAKKKISALWRELKLRDG